MNLAEGLLVIFAVQLIVFAVAEYEGSRLKVLNLKKLFIVWLIFFLGQMIAMGVGYLIGSMPFISIELELSRQTAVIAAVIFLLNALFILYRTWKWKNEDEHLRELLYKRIALEAVGVAAYTLLVGIGCGLLKAKFGITFLVVFLTTIIAVFAGLQTGYAQGDRFHRPVYATSSFLLAVTGIRLLVRYL